VHRKITRFFLFELLNDDLLHCPYLPVLVRVPVPMRVSVTLETWDDVDVKMKDELSGGTVVVDTDVDPVRSDRLLYLWGEQFDRTHRSLENLRRDLVDVPVMFFRDDERVTSVDGVDIEKSERIFVFVYLFCRNLSGGDLAEDAVWVGHIIKKYF
jgi:hypothetical protein